MEPDSIQDILAGAKLRPGALARIERLLADLRRVPSACDLEEFFDALSRGQDRILGIRSGGTSRGGFPGSGGDIAVILGLEPRHCAPIVMALARGRDGRPPNSGPSVMR